MSWNTHVEYVCNKASRTLGLLKRNLKACSPKLKLQAYKSLVRPILEYSCSVWDPYTDKNTSKLEKIQRNAARFIANNYENSPGKVTEILNNLQLESLQARRKCNRLTLFYKIVNERIDIPKDLYLTPATRFTRKSHHQKFLTISTRIDSYKYSFFPRTIPEWNQLPGASVITTSLEDFKSQISQIAKF